MLTKSDPRACVLDLRTVRQQCSIFDDKNSAGRTRTWRNRPADFLNAPVSDRIEPSYCQSDPGSRVLWFEATWSRYLVCERLQCLIERLLLFPIVCRVAVLTALPWKLCSYCLSVVPLTLDSRIKPLYRFERPQPLAEVIREDFFTLTS